MTEYATVLTTTGNAEQARLIASGLVEVKLAACVQSFPINSCYYWDGKVNNDDEVLLLIKTRKDLYDQVEKKIKELHSYTTPEIICLPIITGSKGYLDWISEVTVSPKG
jgi:periplasmic divalent cation tolerance protein